jgi:hypothetical protein
MPAAMAQGGLTDMPPPKSRFNEILSLEDFMLYGGISFDCIHQIGDGMYCLDPNVKPKLTNPSATDYIVPLVDMDLPQYGFVDSGIDVDYIRARQERMGEIVDLVDTAYNDPSVQAYRIFPDNRILYENTDYGMYFTITMDSMTFGTEAVRLIGQLTEDAYNGAMWLDYGFVTNSADVSLGFRDYTEFNLMFNGLMEQIETNSELEDTVDYAAGILGSQMANNEGLANIGLAHEQLDLANGQMNVAQEYFRMGDIADAGGNTQIAQRFDFMGLMSMAGAFYSMGEAYKLKQLVLFMLLDGTFRNNIKMKTMLGTELGPPCDERGFVMCPLPPGANEECCFGCPPKIYLLDNSPGMQACVANPRPKPIGPASPTGSAVASVTAGFDMYDFPDTSSLPEKTKEIQGWYDRIPKFPEVPEDYEADRTVVVKENQEARDAAQDALVMINVPGVQIKDGKYYLCDGDVCREVTISSTGNLVDTETGEVLDDLGEDVGYEWEQFELSDEYLDWLEWIAEWEAMDEELDALAGEYYLSARIRALSLAMESIDMTYKYDLKNLRARDLPWEEREDAIKKLNSQITNNYISVMEKEITDLRVKKFRYLFPGYDEVLSDLLDQRSKAENYDEITLINTKLLYTMGLGEDIALYYDDLRRQNKLNKVS